jgi:hypothetical protein
MVSTGSDIIRLQKRNLLFIPINEQREKLSLTELAENILGYAQINQFNTFDLIYANKNWDGMRLLTY